MRYLLPLVLAVATSLPLAAESSGPSSQRPMLGVEMSPVTTNVQQQNHLDPDQGVLVRATFPGTAADDMGVKPGDVITSINGIAISSMTDLRNEIGSQRVGDPVSVVVRRNDQDVALAPTTIKEWPQNIPYNPIDAEGERRFKDWQQRRLGRQRNDIKGLSNQLAELKKDLAAPSAPGFTKSKSLNQAKLALAMLPPWTLSYEWDTSGIPAAPGAVAESPPSTGDPWLAVAVMSTRFVEL